eukprot:gnl/MRDRNA2_/MRDRNA2_96296_c0_seq1.p1 gnl/MRDRNA2_/MRDRNA2_96296_c0~~gnl/MRDRNA2_/MRDRNA2_96296_c0_seq1.p1  ORF type:complete len:179 (+),score=26.99 gnl/MRDRNA2_/MRDRNA2_96296_c0_seq1:62-538(+)
MSFGKASREQRHINVGHSHMPDYIKDFKPPPRPQRPEPESQRKPPIPCVPLRQNPRYHRINHVARPDGGTKRPDSTRRSRSSSSGCRVSADHPLESFKRPEDVKDKDSPMSFADTRSSSKITRSGGVDVSQMLEGREANAKALANNRLQAQGTSFRLW